jgi:hypothetical protein
MVQAILEGRKTQTRRIVQFPNYHPSREEKKHSLLQVKGFEVYDGNGDCIGELRDVYGTPGDILWVRETFTNISKYKEAPLFLDVVGDFVYKADTDFIGCNKWKPSIHMPKEACRLFLKVTNVRVERLKDISESDAIAEGVDKKGDMYYDYYSEIPQVGRDFYYKNEFAKLSFMGLWSKINGIDSWISNPWVWVIEFERVEKPENFN